MGKPGRAKGIYNNPNFVLKDSDGYFSNKSRLEDIRQCPHRHCGNHKACNMAGRCVDLSISNHAIGEPS